MKLFVAVAPAFLALQTPALAQTQGRGHLTITVEGVLPSGGILRLGLYERKGYGADSNPVRFADVPVKLPVTVVTFTDVPPGDYAVMTYQDVNSNDRTDSNFLGIPTEPYGFSRNARPFLSKPSFDDARFTVSAGENSQTLRLQNTGK